MRQVFTILLVIIFVAGCNRHSSTGAVVRSFGSSVSPDGSKRIEVTRREKSLVDFEVIDSKSGKRLTSDHIGSDAMRWFLYWETSTKLWGYGSDVGYFKLFEFKPDGTVSATIVESTIPVPSIVWQNLPSALQKKQKAHSVVSSNGG
jgi:hypothetical protein